jgi:hypothetical protein
MANQPKFQIFEGKDEQFYFRLKAGNGEIILASEGYSAKASIQNTIDSARKLGQDEQNFDKKTASNGKEYFVLKAGNGETIGRSQMYASAQGRDKGIAAVGRAIGTAVVEDITESDFGPKFEIFQGSDDKYYFHLEASNGQVILASEAYEAKAGAENGVQSVKDHANASQFEKLVADNGQFYFTLKATNGEVIGVSETYKTEAGRDNGIQSVITNAPKAKTEDLTA